MKFFIGLPLILIFTLACSLSWSQDPFSIEDDELKIGPDIFSDFNEGYESASVQEDERFFRYGRFFSLNLSMGLTSFDGNRGQAYENNPPSYGISVYHFQDFQSAYGLGFAYSKHHITLGEPTLAFKGAEQINIVSVSMLRVYFSYRYYLDTSDLGTAITYANPYFIGRMEYWYVTNKFDEVVNIGDDSGGGIGTGLGFGLEFPIKLKESYLGFEFIWHSVDYHDKFTTNYRPDPDGTSSFGFNDLTGNAWTTMVSYVFSW